MVLFLRLFSSRLVRLKSRRVASVRGLEMGMMCVICHNINFQIRERRRGEKKYIFLQNAIFSVPSQSAKRTWLFKEFFQMTRFCLILLRLNVNLFFASWTDIIIKRCLKTRRFTTWLQRKCYSDEVTWANVRSFIEWSRKESTLDETSLKS